MPVTIMMMMAETGIQAGKEPWLSLEWATWIFDRASWVLFGSLVAGALATCAVVWMGTIKEEHWDILREDARVETQKAQGEASRANEAAGKAHERAAALEADAEKARAELGKANADIANAQKTIAEAQRQTAVLQKEAETARLEQERLKAQLAWRTIAPNQLQKMRDALATARGTIFIEYAQNDPEATYLAIQLSHLFSDQTRWQVGTGTVSYPTAVVLGLFVRGKEGNETLQQIRHAFTAAGVAFSSDPPPNVTAVMRSGGAPRGSEDAVIAVGSKQPAL